MIFTGPVGGPHLPATDGLALRADLTARIVAGATTADALAAMLTVAGQDMTPGSERRYAAVAAAVREHAGR